MSYSLCKNYFIDYFWQTPGTHESTGDAASNYCLPYDNKSYWFDVINPTQPADPDRWYIGELLNSTKYYSKYNHEYSVPTLPYTNKMGMYIWAGGHANQNNEIQVIESAAEIPPNASPGGSVRPGFTGQYGKASAAHYTGTQYEGSIQFKLDRTMDEPPDPDEPKAIGGITIYANGGAAGNTDGLHIVFIPLHSFLTVKDIDGNWTTVDGSAGGTGAWAVVRGELTTPIDLILVDYGATYQNGDEFVLDDDTEYFFRIQYWPENKKLKYTDTAAEPDNYPNLDRRIKIFFGDDKKRLKKVATVAAVEADYTSAVNFIQLFAYDYYYDEGTTAWVAYEYTWIGFDEITVNSEWLPWDQMFVNCIDANFPSWTKVLYQKEDNELTHDYASTDYTVPTFEPMDQLRVYNTCNVYPESAKLLFMTDYQGAFPDGWTVTNTTGTWTQMTTPITGFRDDFFNEYSDKGNDPNWTAVTGTWNTTTNSEKLTVSYAAAAVFLRIVGEKDTADDFAFHTTMNMTASAATDTLSFYFGMTAAYGTQNGALYFNYTEGTGWVVAEYNGAAWITTALDTLSPIGTDREVLFIRVGNWAKLYVDGTLVIQLVCQNNSAATGYNYISSVGGPHIISYYYIDHVFRRGYAYMYKTGGTTNVVGDIYKAQAMGQVSFEANITVWEDFENAGDDGEWFLKLHYDNGVAGTNWVGLKCDWDNVTSTKTLTLYSDSTTSTAIDFPDDPKTVKGYVEHGYKILCTVDSSNNITSISVTDQRDGIELGTVTGISKALGANLRMEVEANTSNGCECAYIGRLEITEFPDQTFDRVEVPIAHHEVRWVKPVDDNGFYQVMANAMTYRLNGISEYDVSGGTHVVERSTSLTDILQKVLTEDGQPYYRWFHSWNFDVDIDIVGVNWVEHRQRGKSFLDTFINVLDVVGAHFQCTPEMQMLVSDYYRDFHKPAGDADTDPLELGIARRQGIYWNFSNADDYNLSQTNWVLGINRPDDAQIESRIQDITLQPASFQDPFKGGAGGTGIDQVWQSTAAGHANPTPTDNTPVQRTGNFSNQYGMSGHDRVLATLGARGPPANATTDPTSMLNTWGDSINASLSHKNQLLRLTLFGSKQWYRPMDIIEVKVGSLDPTLMDITTEVHDYKYVVQQALHACHLNTVRYTCGRIEEFNDGQSDVIKVDGYGGIHDPESKKNNLKRIAEDAISQGLQ